MRPAILLALAVLLLASVASAQPRDATAADALFRQGRDAMKRGDYVAACPKFAESNRLDPAAGTVLNLAQCEDKLGMFASAAQHYQEAIDQLPAGDPRIGVAKAGLASATKRAPKLTVRLPSDAPSGTKVLRDDVELGFASMGVALPIDPGEHTVVVRAPGHLDRKERFSIRAGETKELTAAVGELAPEPEPVGPPPIAGAKPPVDKPSTSEASSTLAYVMGGIGLVGLGAGTYFVLHAGSLNDEATSSEHFGLDPTVTANNGNRCDQFCYDKTQESRTASKIGYGCFIAGGLLVAGAATMLILAPSDETTSGATNPSVSFAVGKGAAGVQMGGAW